jgi:hypothetical protein
MIGMRLDSGETYELDRQRRVAARQTGVVKCQSCESEEGRREEEEEEELRTRIVPKNPYGNEKKTPKRVPILKVSQ